MPVENLWADEVWEALPASEVLASDGIRKALLSQS